MTKRSDKASKDVDMQIEQQMRTMLWEAFPPKPHHNRKGWFAHVARALGWGERRTKALFYCEARVVTAEEWKTLNERLNAAKKREREHAERSNEHRTYRGGLGEVVPVAAREEAASFPFATGTALPRKVGET
ncbi:MAG: hypothetical protein ACLGSH_01795 [Acidobacteriota bacterium]